MSVDDIFRISGPGQPDGLPETGGTPDSTEFRRLLERLEHLSRSTEKPRVEDADDLEDALRRAEDDFVAAMDLRRQLEEAFRRCQP